MEEKAWISKEDLLPEPGKKVKIACIHVIDWNLESLVYESTGWLTKGGIWSVKASSSATKNKVFTNKPTHWQEL